MHLEALLAPLTANVLDVKKFLAGMGKFEKCSQIPPTLDHFC